MVYLPRHGPRARGSSRNMQAADSRPGLFSNVVERDCTSWARRPTLPHATRTEPRESDFSGCPRWVPRLSAAFAPAPNPIPAFPRCLRLAATAPQPVLTPGASRRRAGHGRYRQSLREEAAVRSPSARPSAGRSPPPSRDAASLELVAGSAALRGDRSPERREGEEGAGREGRGRSTELTASPRCLPRKRASAPAPRYL